MANVFISHRSSDAAEAERLATELKDRGHEVWLDIWTVRVGDSIVERMNEGLTGMAYLVLCYSDAGVTSPWISSEWMSTLARQLYGEPVKILPVRLTGDVAPAILRDLKHADLVSDWAKGIEDLCAAIR
ncbi:hypothetical protein ABH935_003403 [Catenulispora sp. GAS73]|uniref:toll/interleukin-1 receptor domain-containing protein n=1 Tax=Catenulispora sp. GAS73 TaxID=3156269 RepID=UPI003516C200